MAQVATPTLSKATRTTSVRIVTAAWLLIAVCYFYQYALRSAPAVMMPQLSDAFDLSVVGAASIVGFFYYGYSLFTLVAGAANRLGPQRLLPLAAGIVGVARTDVRHSTDVPSVGRFRQGAHQNQAGQSGGSSL